MLTLHPTKARFSKTVAALIAFAAACVFSSSSSASAEPLRVYLFASSTCAECQALKREFLPRIQKRYGDSIAVSHVAVDDIEQFKLQLLYEKRYGVEDDEALKVFVGETCLSGETAIRDRLTDAIALELEKGSRTPTPEEIRAPSAGESRGSDDDNADAVAAERFRNFKPLGIALAGLVDGMNPCAFTTLIFFVSLLASLKKSKREILIVGTCFALAVFVTYFLLGLGALKAIKVFSVNSGVSKALTVAVAAFAMCLSVVSFYDWLKYRRSRDGADLALKLPERLRHRIRKIMSREMRTRNLVAGALSLGVVVSLLESLCTGQVYLPTIMCVSRDPDLACAAFGYLALYNVMFILPLIAVFALAYRGMTSERMAAFSRKHLGCAKLLLSALFAGLAVALLATVF